jgi:hypothetical protein
MIDENDEKNICEPTGKICYSQREAGIMLNSLKNSRHRWNNRNKIIPLRSYRCEYCNTFHLTHYKKRMKKWY